MGDIISLGLLGRFNVEGVARELRAAAGYGPHEVTGALRFATGYLGVGSVFIVPAEEVCGDGEATAAGEILIRRGLEPSYEEFRIYRACAEHWLTTRGHKFDSLARQDAAYDAVGAALQAPADAFVEAVLEHGEDFAELAEDFDASQTAMALRLGEVTGRAVRVERPGLTRVRGTWKRGGPVRRVQLTDAPDRFAFVAA